MTLSELLQRLQSIKIAFPEIEKERGYKFSGLRNFRKSISPLAQLPALAPLAEGLLSSEIFASNFDVFGTDYPTGSQFATDVASLKITVAELLRILPTIVPPVSEDCIRLKLPDSSDYRGVLTDQDAFLKALEQLLFINPEFTKPITIQGWENGSLWLILCVGSYLAVEVIARAVWAAAVIRNKFREGLLLAEKTKALKVENDFLEHLGAKAKEAVDIIVDAEARAIHQKYFKGQNTNEEVERIKRTLETLAKMVDRGAEIHPALMEPAKAEELFPDYKALNTIQSLIKQLGDETNPN